MRRALCLLATLASFSALAFGSSSLDAPQKRTEDGFALPALDPKFSFPRDHGSHPDFKIEWWYLTGHLRTSTGRWFGYQVTFFRRGLTPGQTGVRDQIYLAHVALSDPQGKRFFHQERLARPGWDADASTTGLDLRNGPWSLRGSFEPDTTDPVEVRAGVRAEVSLRLVLRPAKPLVAFGDRGVSRKGEAESAASHYLTFPRLSTEGQLEVGGESFAVTGETWMDHEISSSQLDRGQVGWDWFGLQLNDGRDIMLYRLRRADGTADPASRLTWVDAQGQTRTAPFEWTVQRTWTSPHTKARYPIVFAIATTDPATGAPVRLSFSPVLDDQELIGKVAGLHYWEGAAEVTSDQPGLSGRAYVELTGYAEDLKF